MSKVAKGTRIVIIGGGFAGLAAARTLKQRHHVTLIDQRKDFEFLPNTHELVSGVRKASQVRISLSKLLERYGHGFHQGKVLEIDPQQRQVRTEANQVFRYDVLIVGTGSQASDCGVPGVFDHALPLHSVDNARQIRRRLRELNQGDGTFNVTIAGAGFIGVECLGEILRRYRSKKRLSITIVESGQRLMKGQPKRVHRRLKSIIRDFDIELLTQERVAAVEPERVVLQSGGRFMSDLTIWTAGIGPAPLLADSGLAAPGRWADARSTLQSGEHEDVFVIGDAAQSRYHLGKQSYHATDMGKHTAKNVERLVEGRKLKRYKPQDEQFLITFGLLSSFYIKDDLVIETPALAGAREALFQYGMREIEDPRSRRGQQHAIQRLSEFAFSRKPFDFARTVLPLPLPLPRDKYDLPRIPRFWR